MPGTHHAIPHPIIAMTSRDGHGVSNNQKIECLFNSLFRLTVNIIWTNDDLFYWRKNGYHDPLKKITMHLQNKLVRTPKSGKNCGVNKLDYIDTNPRSHWNDNDIHKNTSMCSYDVIVMLYFCYASAGTTAAMLYMMTSSNGNIFRVTAPLCGEFTGPGEFPTQRPVTRSFDVFFDLCLNKRLSKQPCGWWFETPSWSLWRQCNGFFFLSVLTTKTNNVLGVNLKKRSSGITNKNS